MEFDKLFDKPFKKDGSPQKYLRLITPFFEKEFSRKEDMLKLMGIDIKADPSKRNSHSTTLARLTSAGVLKTKPRGDGFWRRGENWDDFMNWITKHMITNRNTQVKFKDMLIKYDNNSIDFFMKD